jgi:hypothetical protein
VTEDYHLNLEQFTLASLQHILETEDMLPSRQILKEHISERFAILQSMGIHHVQGLIDALSTKKKLERFAQESGLPEDYLTILGRQARSYIPSPVYFKDIPRLAPDHVERLVSFGIKTTRHLFDCARTRAAREALSSQTGIPYPVLLELVRMADITRAGWVGPVFARMIYETGTDSLEALAQQSAETLFAQLRAINADQQFTKASFSLKDVTACIETAKKLSLVIEYD